MSTFDEREKSFEKKFAHDQELQFKVGARRNKLLGLWAAEKMGLSADDAAAYAKTVVAADFEEGGDDDVMRKVAADLKTKSVTVAAKDLRKQMDDLMVEAKTQIMKDTK